MTARTSPRSVVPQAAPSMERLRVEALEVDTRARLGGPFYLLAWLLVAAASGAFAHDAVVAWSLSVAFALLAGVLLLAGTALGLAIAGLVLVFGKGEERKRLGKRLLLAGLFPIVAGAVWWIAFVGLD